MMTESAPERQNPLATLRAELAAVAEEVKTLEEERKILIAASVGAHSITANNYLSIALEKSFVQAQKFAHFLDSLAAHANYLKEPLKTTFRRAAENLKALFIGIDTENFYYFDEASYERAKKAIFPVDARCVFEMLIELLDKAALAEACEEVLGCAKADEIASQSSISKAFALAMCCLRKNGIFDPKKFLAEKGINPPALKF